MWSLSSLTGNVNSAAYSVLPTFLSYRSGCLSDPSRPQRTSTLDTHGCACPTRTRSGVATFPGLRPRSVARCQLAFSYKIVTHDRAGQEHVRPFASADALAPGTVVLLGGRHSLVERVEQERVYAGPARYRLTLRHPVAGGDPFLESIAERDYAEAESLPDHELDRRRRTDRCLHNPDAFTAPLRPGIQTGRCERTARRSY
jgi:hypothetical protein